MQKEYQNILKEFIQILRERFKDTLISIVLFGSVARGNAKKESDIDLCIVIKNLPKSRFQRNRILSPPISALKETTSYKDLLRKGYLPDISPILYTPDEIQETKPVFLDMVDDGEILLDDGTWYWVLKPGMKLGGGDNSMRSDRIGYAYIKDAKTLKPGDFL